MYSLDDFHAWKDHAITKALFASLHQKIYELQTLLGQTAGSDSLQDKWITGQIFAYREVLQVEPEEVIDVSNSEDSGA